MKRRIQWFNNLPEEIRQKAISRTQEQLSFIDWHEEFISLELCLKSSFSFTKTDEGEAFWKYVCAYKEDSVYNILALDYQDYIYKKTGQLIFSKHEKNSAL